MGGEELQEKQLTLVVATTIVATTSLMWGLHALIFHNRFAVSTILRIFATAFQSREFMTTEN